MGDFYNGKNPADAITYSHKFVEKLTGIKPSGKQITFRQLFGLIKLFADRNEGFDLWDGTKGMWLVIDGVRIDPRISFGKPVLNDSCIKTSMIYARYKGGETVTEIAEDYDISEAAVRAAIEFEEVVK